MLKYLPMGTFFKYSFTGLVLFSFTACVGDALHYPVKEMDLKISHYKVPCKGDGLQLCYLVSQNGGEPEYLYEAIEGFDYEWGYNYNIRVEQFEVRQPESDVSAVSYHLIKELSKEKVATGETFQLPLTMDDQALVQTNDGACNYFGEVDVETGTFSCSELFKAQSAVFRYQADKPGLVLVELK